MVRIKMNRTEKGTLADEPGVAKTFTQGGVFEVDTDLAEAFVTHMQAAELSDDGLFDPLDAPRGPATPLSTQEPAPIAPVMDLAAMAATVADMLKGQFAEDIAAIGARLAAIEERQVVTPDDINLLGDEVDRLRKSLEIRSDEISKVRADHDALRAEFDEALEADEAEAAASAEKPAPKPKATK